MQIWKMHAYEAINQGEGGYHFYNLNTGEMVTYDLVDLFENEFEIHQYDEISQYCNENQIAIVKGNLGNSIMPFACIGDGCTDGEYVETWTISDKFDKDFINQYYLQELDQTVSHRATVTFSARYQVTADSSHTFVNWVKGSGHLSGSINSSSTLDGVRFGYTSVEFIDNKRQAKATFSIYSKRVTTDSYTSFVYEYFICEGEIILNV